MASRSGRVSAIWPSRKVARMDRSPAETTGVGAVLADQHDEWAVARRYLSEESMAALDRSRETADDQLELPS